MGESSFGDPTVTANRNLSHSSQASPLLQMDDADDGGHWVRAVESDDQSAARETTDNDLGNPQP